MRALANLARALAVPALLLGALEWYARVVAANSDALAPPTAAVRAFGTAALDGTLWQATAFTLGSAAIGLAVGAGKASC